MGPRLETGYAPGVDGSSIAYQVVGDGPVDVLAVHPGFFPIDLMWDEPSLVDFVTRLSSFSRNIWFDPRGRGASHRPGRADATVMEAITDDMVSVLDHLGLDRVAVLGLGGPALLFAASYPERTAALVLLNVTASVMRDEDNPDGLSSELLDAAARVIRRQWGTGATADYLGVHADAGLRKWMARSERLVCTPEEAAQRWRHGTAQDLRSVLPVISVPTLVLHQRSQPLQAPGNAYLADQIKGARYRDVTGRENFWFMGDIDLAVDAIEEFLTGELPVHGVDRVLATVMFTDIVGSTARAAAAGDRQWRRTLDRYNVVVAATLERFRGRWIKGTGDGTLATFDGPARAIRCSCAIRDAVVQLGLEVRSGLHTGEIELHGDDIAGIAVHIAARVAAIAGGGDVLVSRTVTDLVAGSGIAFQDRGEHELKGVPGAWRLFSVQP